MLVCMSVGMYVSYLLSCIVLGVGGGGAGKAGNLGEVRGLDKLGLGWFVKYRDQFKPIKIEVG